MKSEFRLFFKELAPPVLQRAYRSLTKKDIVLMNAFATWSAAERASAGYDSKDILDKVTSAALKVKSGEAAYERDSVLFAEIQYSYPVLLGLLRAAVSDDRELSVLDFGGSLGSSYYQCRSFLSELKRLRWSIVEQEHYVRQGKALFEDETLKFYATTEQCCESEKPNVWLFSGVVQYLEDPYDVINRAIQSGSAYIIFDITPFHPGAADIITVQLTPKSIYEASYPVRLFSFDRIVRLFEERYDKLLVFDSLDLPALRKFSATYQGIIFRRR